MQISKFIGRTYQTFQVGYGTIGAAVSVLGWTSIVGYVITRYMPPAIAWTGYLIIPAGVGITAVIFGHLLISKKIYTHQNAISSENNPYVHVPLGLKDYVGWVVTVRNIDITIATTNLDLRWFESMGYDTSDLKEKLRRFVQIREYAQQMVDQAKVMHEIPPEINDKRGI